MLTKLISLCIEYWLKKTSFLLKNTEWHKYMPDKFIGQFTTPNETFRRSYFGKSWRTTATWNSERGNMANFCIEKLKSARPNNNQDCKNASGLYPANMITNGWNLYTNFSNLGYQYLSRTKSMGDNHITTHSPSQAMK